LAPRLQNIQIDAAAVEVCLEVLVDNAMDAIQGNQAKNIEIALREVEAAERALASSTGKLAIDVIDNGPGVPPDMAERLFISMRSGKPKGAGIGLLHCHSIARSAHGDVHYDAAHISGAKFTLLFPYSK
jgi:two-component system C4-dicarboxylate transport sensor histidine kinase DctB